MHCVHPLIDRELPDFTLVRQLCDDEAGALLDVAMSLARWRVKQCQTAADHLTAAAHCPRVDSMKMESVPGLRRKLMPIDVLRAVVGLRPEIVTAMLHHTETTEGLAEDARYWSGIVAANSDLSQPEIDVYPLERVWRRRWALTVFKECPKLRAVDVACSIFDDTCECLRQYSRLWKEIGAITSAELYDHVRRFFASAGAHPLNAPGDAYYDRHGGLKALDESFRRFPQGAIINGQPGSGRTSLINCWATALPAQAIPNCELSHLMYRRIFIEQDGPTTYCETWRYADGRSFLLTDPVGWLESDEALCGFLQRAGLHPPPWTIFVRSPEVTSRELSEKMRYLSLVSITVPPVGDRDQIPIALCANPVLEDRGHDRISVAELLTVLTLLSRRNDLAACAKDHLREVGHMPSPGSAWHFLRLKHLHEECFPAPTLQSLRLEWEKLLSRAGGPTTRSLGASDEQAQVVERFVGSREDLEELGAFERSVP